ncbi:hypothetical protein LPU83_pLPU83c_0552 (plasmid) [Rhizobium favelukesii]|uniref:Uncharacterized protein n=1 Tax=Rhizobium favelukesii TaxID=348824 RepID=W6RJT7_9HYPH|nr:hypothetical protein LPU83_pLPU83c_0552 [Rhizobium favelukesii]
MVPDNNKTAKNRRDCKVYCDEWKAPAGRLIVIIKHLILLRIPAALIASLGASC